MSTAKKLTGLPLWSTYAIMVGVLVVGGIFSVFAGSLGKPFLIAFALAAVFVTTWVEPRGIFLTGVGVPILFGLAIVFVSWGTVVSKSTGNKGAFSRTTIVTSIYPLANQFPWIFWVTAICVVIGVVRVWLLRRQLKMPAKVVNTAPPTPRQPRRAAPETNRRTRSLSQDAQRRSRQLTVEEIMARSRSNRTGGRHSAPPTEPQRRPRRVEDVQVEESPNMYHNKPRRRSHRAEE